MKQGESAGPEVEERQEGAGKSTNVVHPEYRMERPGWRGSQETEGEPCQGMQQRWEAQWQELLKTLQSPHSAWGNLQLPEATPWDDTKAFLASFEQVAKACRWPRGEWAARLLPALTGEAEEAFGSLEARDQEDYGKVKAAILRGEALRMEAQRQHFRQFCCQEVRDPRRIHSQVQELCWQWLKPERHSKEQILELLILEQFLASLPVDLQGWIRAGGPDTCSQAVALAEDFLMGQKETETGQWQQGLISLKETGASLHVVKQTPVPPGQHTIFWQVLQEDDGSMPPSGERLFQSVNTRSISSRHLYLKEQIERSAEIVSPSNGEETGGQLKMENSPYGGYEPEEIPKTAPQMSQENLHVAADMHEERRDAAAAAAAKAARETPSDTSPGGRLPPQRVATSGSWREGAPCPSPPAERIGPEA
ncbi:zinc finger and SCAN domain-containing protein 21-like [Elgaria multicarinata webbii]|uniref:zinc finger and SCAN domain-containing protein 21-like n=1 Tax=Elgaria multicarinata webbii TaxID=159646 RepID=UPI002FCD39DF